MRFEKQVLVLALSALLALSPSLPVAHAAAEGEMFPTFSLADVSTGESTDPGQVFKGKVGALVYMQTSCAACRKELQALKDLQPKFPSFSVVVVSVDSGNPARVKRYKEHFGFDWPFLHDPEFKTPELFGFAFTPALVMVDKAGKVALLKGGYRPGDEAQLENQILALTGK